MGFRYSSLSTKNLFGVHPKLVELFNGVLEHFDHAILGGARTVEQQKKNVAAGLSQTMDSKHLPQADGLSHAVDAAPVPQRWESKKYRDELMYFGGFVKGYAAAKGIRIRFGGDFNRNNDVTDSGFEDLDHFELENE
jgi:peptidoglycan L-alanyl-D-glutamate endopeptidase CwlK